MHAIGAKIVVIPESKVKVVRNRGMIIKISKYFIFYLFNILNLLAHLLD